MKNKEDKKQFIEYLENQQGIEYVDEQDYKEMPIETIIDLEREHYKDFVEEHVNMIVDSGFENPNTREQLTSVLVAIEFLYRQTNDRSNYVIELCDFLYSDLLEPILKEL